MPELRGFIIDPCFAPVFTPLTDIVSKVLIFKNRAKEFILHLHRWLPFSYCLCTNRPQVRDGIEDQRRLFKAPVYTDGWNRLRFSAVICSWVMVPGTPIRGISLLFSGRWEEGGTGEEGSPRKPPVRCRSFMKIQTARATNMPRRRLFILRPSAQRNGAQVCTAAMSYPDCPKKKTTAF